jgi:SAM-dependent methyltransferase
VNLGSGLTVAPGWINVDASLNAVVAGWPKVLLRGVYRLTNVSRWFSVDEYVSILRSNRFVAQDLRYGVPLPNASVDFVFSAHCLEHMSADDGSALMHEVARVLRPGGTVRVQVPDLAATGGEKGGGFYDVHRCMYDFDRLRTALEQAGLERIRRCEPHQGSVPDIEILDRPSGAPLFVEANLPDEPGLAGQSASA